MSTDTGYDTWWNGEPDGAPGDGDWIQYAVGNGHAALKHMGQV